MYVYIHIYIFKNDKEDLYLKMEWAPFKCIFWNGNGSILKLMISSKRSFFVTQALLQKYAKLWQGYKRRFSLTVEQILAFVSSNDFVREVKNLFPNFKRIA